MHRTRPGTLAVLLGLVTALSVVPAAAVNAATTTVACPTDDLAAAIEAASPGDTLAITGTCTGNFVVDKDLTIIGKPGARATLDGASVETTLTVLSAAVTISNLTITGGRGCWDFGCIDGGGIANYGGMVTLLRSRVSDNGASSGGGILNADGGSLTLTDSVVSDNGAESAGGIYNVGGAVTLNGTSSVKSNLAAFTGGVLSYDGVITLNDSSSVSSNEAVDFFGSAGGVTVYGGALILNDGASITGNEGVRGGGIESGPGISDPIIEVILNDSASVARNRSQTFAGGIWSSGTLILNDSSSVSRNSADFGAGGGIVSSGTAVVNDFASVTGNSADHGMLGAGGFFESSGGGIANFGTLTLNDSASVTGNTADDPAGRGGGIYNDPTGTITLEGSASVVRNTAGGSGGGIFSEVGVFVCAGSTIRMSPNNPDDPPAAATIGC